MLLLPLSRAPAAAASALSPPPNSALPPPSAANPQHSHLPEEFQQLLPVDVRHVVHEALRSLLSPMHGLAERPGRKHLGHVRASERPTIRYEYVEIGRNG